VEHIQSVGGGYDGGKHPFHWYLGYSTKHPMVDVEREVGWVTGAAIALPTSLFRRLGGFDPVYERAYFEDVDLCERAKKAGAEIWYAPFTHYVGQSTQTVDEMTGMLAARSFQQNRARYHKRWDETITPDIASVLSPNT
jgi:GT2 family glycosyltransferase